LLHVQPNLHEPFPHPLAPPPPHPTTQQRSKASRCAALLGVPEATWGRILAGRSNLAKWSVGAVQQRVEGLMNAFGCTRELVGTASAQSPTCECWRGGVEGTQEGWSGGGRGGVGSCM